MIQKFLCRFLPVWNVYSEHPLPPFLQNFCPPPSGRLPDDIRSLTPAVGFAAGLIGTVFLWLIYAFFSSPVLQFAAGIAVCFAVEYLTAGRDLAAFTHYILRRKDGYSPLSIFTDGMPAEKPSAEPDGMLIMLLVLLLRIGIFGLLGLFHLAFWLPVAFTGAYLFRSEAGKTFMKCHPGQESAHWITGAVLLLGWGCLMWHFGGAAFALAVVWGGTAWLKHLFPAGVPGVFFPLNAYGYAMETLLLLAGLLLYI